MRLLSEGDEGNAPATFFQLGAAEGVDVGMLFDPFQYCAADFALPLAVDDTDMMESRHEGRIQVFVQGDHRVFDAHVTEMDFQGGRIEVSDQEGGAPTRLALPLSPAPTDGFDAGCAAGEAAVGLGGSGWRGHGLVAGAGEGPGYRVDEKRLLFR